MEENKAPAKTLILRMADFRRSLVDLVNNSGLPAPITVMIVKEMMDALDSAAVKQYSEEQAAYDALVKENANDVRSN